MSKPTNITFKLSLTNNSFESHRIDILKNLLISLGVNSTEIIELEKDSVKVLEVYFQLEVKAKRLYEKLEEAALQEVELELKSLLKDEWLDVWKKDFKPFVLTEHFEVVPIWLKESYVSKQEAIYIDTSLAFGTGLHETTRFMAELIGEYSGKFETVFDIGTGTGILGIIARKCGAKYIKAVDISSDAVEMARLNFKENGCKVNDLGVMDIKSFRGRRQYDFVAANLITHDLIKFGDKILRFVKQGKYLAVSGISVENFKMLEAAFKKYPLKSLEIKRGEKWVACLYQKV